VRTRPVPGRRGFSTLEIILALGIFMALSVSLAQVTVQIASSVARNAASLELAADVEARVRLLAQTPFGDLVDGAWTAPDPCPGDAGGDRRSCFVRRGQLVEIDFTVTAGSLDAFGGTTLTSPYIDVTGVAVTPDGTVVTKSVRVDPPSAGFVEGAALLRVRAVNDDPAALLPIYVLDRHHNVVTERFPFDAGTRMASIRIEGDACAGDNAPCRIALSPEPGSWWEDGAWTLSPQDIVSPSTELYLAPGHVVDTSTLIVAKGRTTVAVRAENASGERVSGAEPGSVCLWASFADGVGRTAQPYCNTGGSSAGGAQIVVDAWTGPDGVRYPMPAGWELDLTVDHPNGSCPPSTAFPAGAHPVGHTAAGWGPADVCTSWTWGRPSTWVNEADVASPFTGTRRVVTSAAGTVGTLVWTEVVDGQPAGRPASGSGFVPAWSKPRDAAEHPGVSGCAIDGDPTTVCVSPGTTTPETAPDAPAGCATDAYCFSRTNLAPVLANPGPLGTIQVPHPTGNQLTFTVADPEGQPVSFVVTAPPAHGTLSGPGASPDGLPAPPATGPSPSDFVLTYDKAAGFDNEDAFTVEIADPGGLKTTRTVTVYEVDAPFFLSAPTVTTPQGFVGLEIPVSVTGFSGNPVGGETLRLALDPHQPGAAFTVTTAEGVADTEGRVTFAVDVGATTAGSYDFTVTADASGRTLQVPVTVTPAAGAISVAAAAGGPQGGNGSVTVSAVDLAGDPFVGARVWVNAARAGTPSGKVRGVNGACVTDGAGTCTETLLIASDAVAGTYTVTVSSGALTATTTVTVTPVATTITTPAGTGRADLYGPSVTRSAPIHWWRLDDTGGTAAAAAGGVNGTFTGGVTTARPPLAGGDQTSSVRFDGVDGAMCAGPLTVGGVPLSVEAWIRPESFSSSPSATVDVFGVDGGGSSGVFALRIGDGATDQRRPVLRAAVNGTVWEVVSSARVTAGNRHHLAGTYDGTSLRLFLDGQLVGRTDVSGPRSASGTWCAGQFTAGAFAGDIDEVAVYGHALSPATIARHIAAAGAGGRHPVLPIDQGGTATVTVTVLDGAGRPMPAAALGAASSAGLHVTGPSTADGSGGASFTVTADTAVAAGPVERGVLVSSGAVTLPFTVFVTGVPASLDVPVVALSRGTNDRFGVVVRDGTGEPLAGETVTVTAAGPTTGLRWSNRAVSGLDGVAHITMTADRTASGATLTVTAGAVSAPMPVQVLAGVGTIRRVDPTVTVPRGGQATLAWAVSDADGAPVVGVPFAVTCDACGLSFASTVTNSSGRAEVVVTDTGGSNPAGEYLVRLNAAGATATSRVAVTAEVGSLLLSSPPSTVPAGSVSWVRVRAVTAAGAPVVGATVGVESTGMVRSPGALTGPDGWATVRLDVPAGAAGSVVVTVVSGEATATFPLTVTP
jgi:hypothetical protein